MKTITDDYVLSKETLTSHEAADYLGISWWNLTDGLKTGTYRFGTAKANKSGKYTYTIYAKQAYNFKHGTYDVDQQQYADLVKKLDEVADTMQVCVQMMQTLLVKKENAPTPPPTKA